MTQSLWDCLEPGAPTVFGAHRTPSPNLRSFRNLATRDAELVEQFQFTSELGVGNLAAQAGRQSELAGTPPGCMGVPECASAVSAGLRPPANFWQPFALAVVLGQGVNIVWI